MQGRNRRELGLPPLSGNFREQQRQNARYRDSVTDQQLNAPAYVESSKNKLIEGANILAYFQNQGQTKEGTPLRRDGRPRLSEEELVNIIIDKKAARKAIQEGKITPRERNALMRQAGRQLQQFDNDETGIKRENKSRNRIVTAEELDRLDSQGQGRDQSEMMDGQYEKSGREADNSAYVRQARYLMDESAKPAFVGSAGEQKIYPKLADKERKRRRYVKDLRYGDDYENIAVAPASATRGTTSEQITAAALADKSLKG